jgi:3-methyladenine DNA glycosylase Mpg
MNFLKLNFENKDTLLDSIEILAKKIANDVQLKVNNTYYRIVDFEFYAFSQDFQDPYTHNSEQSINLHKERGKIYVHRSGMDITCGDGVNRCGILLRSIIKLGKNENEELGLMIKQYQGPRIVTTEFFSNLNPILDNGSNAISIIDLNGRNQDSPHPRSKHIIKTNRVGLPKKTIAEDGIDYLNLPLRYVVILPKFNHNKTGFEAILKENIASKRITKEEANEIIGYNLKL